MKLSRQFAVSTAAALLCIAGAGCQTHKTVTTLGNGYEEVWHPYHTWMDEPPPPRVSLQHRDAAGDVTPIWPSLYGADLVIKGDLALFVAEKAYVEPERVTHPRLFAVRTPELPLDITDEVLWRWSKASGKDFAKTRDKFAGIMPEEKNGGVELRLEFWSENPLATVREETWPDQSSLQLDWPQVEEIIHAVKTKGMVENDLRWHAKYVGEKF